MIRVRSAEGTIARALASGLVGLVFLSAQCLAQLEQHDVAKGQSNVHELVTEPGGILRIVLVPGDDPLTVRITGRFSISGRALSNLEFSAEQEYGGLVYLFVRSNDGSVALHVASQDPVRSSTRYGLLVDTFAAATADTDRGMRASFPGELGPEQLRLIGSAWLDAGQAQLAMRDYFLAGTKYVLDHQDFEAGVRSFRQALQIALDLEDSPTQAWLYRWIAVVQNLWGELGEAEQSLCAGLRTVSAEDLEDCSPAFGAVSTNALRASLVLANEIGLTAHWKAHLADAERWYSAVLQRLEQEYPWERQRAVTLNNLGGLEFQRGNYAAAREAFQAAHEIHVERNEQRERVSNLSNLGLVEEKLGNLNVALTHYGDAMALAGTVSSHSDEALILRRLGELNRNIGRLPVARQLADRALAVFAARGDVQRTLDIQLLLGDIELEAGNVSDARRYYLHARATSEQIGDSESLVRATMQLARVSLQLGSVARAKGYADGAESVALDVGLFAYAPQIADVNGQIAEATGDLLKAEIFYEKSRNLSEDIPSQYIGSTTSLARVLRARDPRKALVTLDGAERQVEQWRAGITDPYVEAEVAHRISRLVEERVHTHLELSSTVDGQIETALLVSDGMRSRVLDRLRADPRVEVFVAGGLDSYTSSPSGSNSPRRMPELRSDERVLAFEIAEPRSYAWFVAPEGVRLLNLPGRAELRELTERALSILQSLNTPDDAPWHLATALMAPVSEDIDGKTLYVVADEFLHSVPFAALPHPDDSNRPLVVESTVINVPSLDWIRRPRDSSWADLRSLFAIGEPTYATQVLGTAQGDVLPPLPWSRVELDSIALRFEPTQVRRLDRERASRDALLGEPLAGYDVLHFAAHGVVDLRFPELSGLFLSTVDLEGQPMEGFVSARDIARLGIDAKLVVLSACDTGLGRTLSGEGPLSLSWSFLAAGAQRVVSSLWAVPDRSTSQLMIEFYRQLVDRQLQPAEALRQAQLSLYEQRRTRRPYYWAGFVMIGA
jgi:CHAT domain-containing protein